MGWLDLHMHSKYSDDGQYSPKELMSLCLQSGVRTAAVADHNSTRGVKEACYWAARMGICVIPAIEIDCTCRGANLHVLGYWIDPDYAGFEEIEQAVLVQEKEAANDRLRLIREQGIHIDASEAYQLAGQGTITGEIIAEAALQDMHNDKNPLLDPYRPGGSRCDNPFVNFYWDYFSQSKPAYVPIEYINLSETIELIRKAGGIAVLAHPGNNIHEDISLLHEIVKTGVCGLEVFSSYHSPEQKEFYRKEALRMGLAMSCGSDFHGKTKPSIQVGSVDCDTMETELITGLLEKMEG